MDSSSNQYILRIYRGSPGNQYWEEFELELVPLANVISSLMEIQKNPVNRQGKRVEPVVWEQGCLEEVCGSCTMLVNGKPRQACTALIAPIIETSGSSTIVLAPITKFPLIRDLCVDRTSMFENLKKVHAWIESDGSFDRGFSPPYSQAKQQAMYAFSRCMTCGCCVEVCPQVNERSAFVGPQIIAQVPRFNTHPLGKDQKAVRLRALMGDDGLENCGNAQNCERFCPKNIPLLDAIAGVGRDLTIQSLQDLFSFPDRED